MLHVIMIFFFIFSNEIETQIDKSELPSLAKFPVGIYLLKVNNRNTRTRCETCLKLTIKIPERRHW